MGLDVGEKNIGVAICDELGLTAQPFEVLRRRDLGHDLRALRELVKEHWISEIVVGLPREMKGTVGRQARTVMAFAEKVGEDLGLPVILWDERLSTVAANRALLEADLSRRKRKARVDKVAAALILQGYLDSGRLGRRSEE
jgi:putative Holliday junction resolvase